MIEIITIDEYSRDLIIKTHNFYFEQSKIRLLSQFKDIEEDAEKYKEDRLEELQQFFNPDIHHPEDFYERSLEDSIDFYLKLHELKNNTYLNTASALYFNWDKTVRSILIDDLKKSILLPFNAEKSIWKANFHQLMDLFIALGWNIDRENFYMTFQKYSTVVNVCKHGDGQAFIKLKNEYPEYIKKPFENQDLSDAQTEFAKYTDLFLSDEHLKEFSDAVLSFWETMPKSFFVMEENEYQLPNWFLKNFDSL